MLSGRSQRAQLVGINVGWFHRSVGGIKFPELQLLSTFTSRPPLSAPPIPGRFLILFPKLSPTQLETELLRNLTNNSAIRLPGPGKSNKKRVPRKKKKDKLNSHPASTCIRNAFLINSTYLFRRYNTERKNGRHNEIKAVFKVNKVAPSTFDKGKVRQSK